MANNVLNKINLNQLGERLQQARKQCGMTQAEAAKIIKVPVLPSSLLKRENVV